MRKIVLLVAVAIITGCAAPDAPVDLTGLNAGWRTDGTGKYLKADPPVEWSTEKNVVWKTPMPDFSNATPVIAGNKIFVCSEPDTLICLSKKSGEILWKKGSDFYEMLTADELAHKDEYRQKGEELTKQKNKLGRKARGIRKKLREKKNDKKLKAQQDALKAEIAELDEELAPYKRFIQPAAHAANGHTSPTPVCDAENVYVNFGTGVAAAYTHTGDRVWMVETEKPWHVWGHSSSPILADGNLVVYVKDVVALDAATGKEVWRFTPQTEEKEQPRWGSMVQTVIGGKTVVITPNSDFLTAAAGKALAQRVCPLSYNAPVLDNGNVYFIQHKGGAYKLPVSVDGDFVPEELWRTEPKKGRYYASPVLHDGLIYGMTSKMDFSVIDAKTGAVVFEEQLDLKKEGYPSLALAGGYVYVSGDKGKTIVFKPGKKPEQVAVNELEQFRSSPVFEGMRMYVRGYKNLYCIGK